MTKIDEITVRFLGPEDHALLCATTPGLFDNAVRPDQARAFLEDPACLMVVAMAANAILAFASATVLRHPDKAPLLFVNEVGTRDEAQRQGHATRLMRALFAWAREKGIEGIWLATEPDNAPALGLYRKLSGQEETITGFAWDGAFDP